MTNKIIEVLNNNPEAKKLLGAFDKAAEQNNVTGEEYNAGRAMTIQLAISITPEAMALMANHYHAQANA